LVPGDDLNVPDASVNASGDAFHRTFNERERSLAGNLDARASRRNADATACVAALGSRGADAGSALLAGRLADVLSTGAAGFRADPAALVAALLALLAGHRTALHSSGRGVAADLLCTHAAWVGADAAAFVAANLARCASIGTARDTAWSRVVANLLRAKAARLGANAAALVATHLAGCTRGGSALNAEIARPADDLNTGAARLGADAATFVATDFPGLAVRRSAFGAAAVASRGFVRAAVAEAIAEIIAPATLLGLSTAVAQTARCFIGFADRFPASALFFFSGVSRVRVGARACRDRADRQRRQDEIFYRLHDG